MSGSGARRCVNQSNPTKKAGRQANRPALPARSTLPALPALFGAAPEHALGRRHRSDTLEEESLDTLPFVGFGRVHVALRIRGDAVDAEELTGLTAAVAEARQQLQ